MRLQRVLFRADASVDIGSGHVMRCLALAGRLREGGADCVFVGRDLPGHLMAHVERCGFATVILPPPSPSACGAAADAPPHAAWLGTTWQEDSTQTLAATDLGPADLLVVDHYALDLRWERALRARCERLLAIDDVADRAHDCDVLLDQNCGRRSADYDGLVAPHCVRLIGPDHALLRPEFGAARARSLHARQRRVPQRMLVSMGGMDRDGYTTRVLHALAHCALPHDLRIDVVMGGGSPHLGAVRAAAATMPRVAEVMVDVGDMATMLAEVDLAIGGAGTSAIERCCLGVPSVLVVMADNQRQGARALASCGAASVIDDAAFESRLVAAVEAVLRPGALAAMSAAAARVTDGSGCDRVVEALAWMN